MKQQIRLFIEREEVTVRKLFNPLFVTGLLIRYRYFHFFFVGLTGVAINLVLTWIFAEFVFGRERYFDAYLIGLFGNISYNFLLHTIVTFRTKRAHFRRFIIFITYVVLMTALQAYLVKIITPLIGLDYYLFVIATIILVFSTISFLVMKLSMFNERVNENENTPA